MPELPGPLYASLPLLGLTLALTLFEVVFEPMLLVYPVSACRSLASEIIHQPVHGIAFGELPVPLVLMHSHHKVQRVARDYILARRIECLIVSDHQGDIKTRTSVDSPKNIG